MPIRLESVNCNLCGSNNYRIKYNLQDIRFSDTPKDFFNLVECKECGLLYLNPRPNKNSMKAFYSSKFYRRFYHEKHKGRNSMLKRLFYQWSDAKNRNRISEKVSNVLRWTRNYVSTRPLQILDVGCGGGDFLKAMKQNGWRVSGIEIDLETANYVRKQLDVPVVTTELENCDFCENQFDVVTFWSVLEHLYDPNRSLKEIVRILRPGGKVVILVPNADSAEQKILGNLDKHPVDVPRHLYHFSPITLGKMMRKVGLTNIKISYYTQITDSRLMIIIRTINNYLPKKWLSATISIIGQELFIPINYSLSLMKRSHSFILCAEKVK